MFEFDAAIATGIPEGIRLLALLHERAAVWFRLELEGVPACTAIEQAREQVCATPGVLGLNPAAFQQGDDFGMLLRCFDRRVCVLDDDPIFARDHFERRGFPFLVESTARFAIDALRSDNEGIRLLKGFLDPRYLAESVFHDSFV